MESKTQQDDEVEIFETTGVDAPVVEDSKQETKENPDIVEAPLRPRVAFERFAGTVFTGGDAKDAGIHQTFSERLEYNSLTAKTRKFESPMERLNRLKAEVADFQRDVETIAKQSDSKDDSVTSLSNQLAQELASLDSQLQGVATNTTYQPFLQQEYHTESSMEQRMLLNKLLGQIRSVGSGNGNLEVKGGTGNGSGGVTYELFYDGTKEAQRQHEGVAALDRRVAAVERAVGNKNPEVGNEYADIHSAIGYLNRRIDLLDQAKLDAISRRIRTLIGDLESIQTTRNNVQGEEKALHQEKINEIYQLMLKWDDAASQLPTVIGRLQSLKELHEESAAVVLRAQAIDTEHSQVTASLAQNNSALESVQKSMQENAETMQRNVEALEKRMAELATKIGLI